MDYTWSHLENERNVTAYILGKALVYRARATCVFSHTFEKGIPRIDT